MWQGGKIIIPLLCSEEVMICLQWHGEFSGCGWRSHPPNMEGSYKYVEYSFIDNESWWLSSLPVKQGPQILMKGKLVAK
jgi:hypothetical protein